MRSRYREYLQSEHWKLLRGAKLQVSPTCERCPARDEIEVHHKFYRPNWEDAVISDLQTLCRTCHLAEHAKDWEELPEGLKPAARPEFVAERDQPRPPRPKNKLPRMHGPLIPRRRRMRLLREEGDVPRPDDGVLVFKPFNPPEP